MARDPPVTPPGDRLTSRVILYQLPPFLVAISAEHRERPMARTVGWCRTRVRTGELSAWPAVSGLPSVLIVVGVRARSLTRSAASIAGDGRAGGASGGGRPGRALDLGHDLPLTDGHRIQPAGDGEQVLGGRAADADAGRPEDLAALNPPMGAQYIRDRPGYRSGRTVRGRIDLDPVTGGQAATSSMAGTAREPNQDAATLRGRNSQLLEYLRRANPVGDAQVHNRHRSDRSGSRLTSASARKVSNVHAVQLRGRIRLCLPGQRQARLPASRNQRTPASRRAPQERPLSRPLSGRQGT